MASKQSKQWTTAQLELIAQLKKEKEGFVQDLSEWIKKHPDQDYQTVLESWQETTTKITDLMLKLFELSFAHQSPKTLNRQIADINFYIGDFTALHEGNSPFNFFTSSALSSFFGNYYISHCLWSTPASLKREVASEKKLAKLLFEAGVLSQEEYQDGFEEIKEYLDWWCEECRDFNDSYQNEYSYLKRIF